MNNRSHMPCVSFSERSFTVVLLWYNDNVTILTSPVLFDIALTYHTGEKNRKGNEK